MKDKAIELIVRKETDTKSAIAEGYILKKAISLKGAYDILTITVGIEGDPKAVEKAMKALKVNKLENKCTIVFSEYINPQTSLDDHV